MKIRLQSGKTIEDALPKMNQIRQKEGIKLLELIKKSIIFDVNKYNEIMNHISEYDDKDIKITSPTDADIFNKIRDGGYSYELNLKCWRN